MVISGDLTQSFIAILISQIFGKKMLSVGYLEPEMISVMSLNNFICIYTILYYIILYYIIFYV